MRYDAGMPQKATSIQIDRISVMVRWAALVVLALLPAMRAPVGIAASVPLMLAMLWNGFLSFLVIRGRRFEYQVPVSIGVDALLALWLFYNTGTALGPWVWAGLLPILPAAVLLGLVGGTATALAVTLGFGLLALVDVAPAQLPAAMVVPAFFFILAGLAAGYAAEQFHPETRANEGAREIPPEVAQQREDERIKTLVEIASILGGSMLYDQILDLALDVSEKVLMDPDEPVSRLVGAILLFQEEGLRVAASRRLAASDQERTLPGTSGLLKQVSEMGEAKLQRNPASDPELMRLVGIHTCATVYCIPLRAGFDLYGVMLFGHVDPDYFTAERTEMLDVVARQVMVSLQNAQLYETLNVEKQRIVDIQEQAQQQLARNLHDGPTQSVAAIAMRVNLIRRMVKDNKGNADEELFKLEDLARRTTKEMRHMLFALRPKSLETGGLVTALEDLVKQTEETYDQPIFLEAKGVSLKRMDLGRQGVLFHIAAEAIANARKHAKASKIGVRLGVGEDDMVLLEVMDNGEGFDQQEAEDRRAENGGLGLPTMRERVELISGMVRIESELGKGTIVRVWTPMNAAAAGRVRYGPDA